ncbi:MAG: glycosyltransferase family 2 protein [Gemmatimonadales bacterium]
MAVVIPAYQAARTIADIVSRVRQTVPGAEVCVLDDGSTDDTGRRAREAGATVIAHPGNCGKGAALASGITAALAGGATAVATLDADGQHPPETLPALLAPVMAGEADLVLGGRRRTHPMPLSRRLTNWLSARLASRLAGQPVTDAQTGYRVFTAELARRVRPSERHYDFETAFLLDALAAGCRVQCVLIPTVYDGTPSHFRSLADTWRIARVFRRHARGILWGRRGQGRGRAA